MKIKNPRTGQYYYEIFPPSSKELKAKTDLMREAQIAWAGLNIEVRIQALQAWKEAKTGISFYYKSTFDKFACTS